MTVVELIQCFLWALAAIAPATLGCFAGMCHKHGDGASPRLFLASIVSIVGLIAAYKAGGK